MPTQNPPEPELRALLRKLHNEVAIHESANEDTTNPAVKRTNDILIAEARVAIAWVKYLLQEPLSKAEEEYRKFLPRY